MCPRSKRSKIFTAAESRGTKPTSNGTKSVGDKKTCSFFSGFWTNIVFCTAKAPGNSSRPSGSNLLGWSPSGTGSSACSSTSRSRSTGWKTTPGTSTPKNSCSKWRNYGSTQKLTVEKRLGFDLPEPAPCLPGGVPIAEAVPIALQPEPEQYLRPRQVSWVSFRTFWTDEEDLALLDHYIRLGRRWKQISILLAGRSENAIKNRFSLLWSKYKKRKSNNDITEIREQILKRQSRQKNRQRPVKS